MTADAAQMAEGHKGGTTCGATQEARTNQSKDRIVAAVEGSICIMQGVMHVHHVDASCVYPVP